MKRLVATILVFVCLGFIACNSDEKKLVNNAGSTAILMQPPYQTITDSINADKKNIGLILRRAELLTQNGEHELANKDLENAWSIEPSERIAEFRVSNLFMMGQNKEALELLKEMTAKYPANLNLKRRMGEALLQNGQYDQAIAIYDKMIETDSLDFEAYYEKGLLLLETKDTLNALNNLEKSYRVQPLQLTALTMANLYAELKNKRALELADAIINRDSGGSMVDPHFIKGVYYANTKNFSRALDQFDDCIKIDWKFQEAYIEKGIIYFDQKNLDEALKQFKLASRVSNTFADAYYWQGRCYEQLKNYDEALNNYTRAFALDKKFREAIEGAARVKEAMGNK